MSDGQSDANREWDEPAADLPQVLPDPQPEAPFQVRRLPAHNCLHKHKSKMGEATCALEDALTRLAEEKRRVERAERELQLAQSSYKEVAEECQLRKMAADQFFNELLPGRT